MTLMRLVPGARPGNGTVFTDVCADDWFSGAVGFATASGLMKGYKDGSFGPYDTVTRQKLVTALYLTATYFEGEKVFSLS